MTPRQVVNDFVGRHLIALVVGAFAFGGAWMLLQGQVANKADSSTVEAMARDIRTIKLILCRQQPGDSYCAELP